MNNKSLRILVLCTVESCLDAIAAVHLYGGNICGVVGIHPKNADEDKISGYTDIRIFGNKHNIPSYLVESYTLTLESDRALLESLSFDILWVAGWQRLIPEWLIKASPMGALGVHGSPDGIQGGRGRSPQNWAIILNCRRFDLALFKITTGIDDGPVISKRTFFYHDLDDIRISYYRTSLALSEMVVEILECPELLHKSIPQAKEGFYFPQRLPEDGYVDWRLPSETIARHCRALSKPYPGLRVVDEEYDIRLWDCQTFDDQIKGEIGQVDFVFESGEFLVNCLDGRLLVRIWSADKQWRPRKGMVFKSFSFLATLEAIVKRHQSKYPNNPITNRILRYLK